MLDNSLLGDVCRRKGVSRERDELIALLNARERHCFETLSFVGQSDASGCCSTECRHRTDGTTLKVHLSRSLLLYCSFLYITKNQKNGWIFVGIDLTAQRTV